MVVRKMRELLEKAGTAMIAAAVSLSGPDPVSAHIFDERPGLGTGMTIALSAFWIAVVTGIVFLVRRLMRPRQNAKSGQEDNSGEKD
jgi:hypothetical protein